MKLPHRIRFYQQLAVLVRAGVPILTNLTRLNERMPEKETAVLLEKVRAGERIGDAFAAAGFSPFECHLITAGEQSGHLDTIFQHLSEFWDKELRMRQAIIRPLYYPVAVLHLAVVVDAVIEATTNPLSVAITHFFIWMTLLYLGGFITYVLLRVSWSSPAMRRFWLCVPMIGNSLTTAYAYRWITALKLEFIAGIPLSRAIGDAWRASGYLGCDRFAAEGEQAMRQGAPLSQLMLGWKQLPRDWVDFMETGEISGALEETFTRLEEEAARSWKLAQDRLSEWLPKILYFIVLLVVAAKVLSLGYKVYIAPMNDMENQIDNALGGE